MKKKTIVLLVLDILAFCGFFVVYGPFEQFRSWYITTAVNTMTHRYFAYIFYSDEMITDTLNKNYIVPLTGESDLNDIVIDNEEKNTYENEYEKELLTRDPDNNDYKIIKIKVGNYTGLLAAIYDPSQVRVITAKVLGTGGNGEKVISMCNRNGATLCINGAGGKVNAQDYTTDIPEGAIIQDGEIVWSTDNSRKGPYIGLTYDNKLMLSYSTPTELIEKGVRDAMQWWPFLILNGKSMQSVGTGGFGNAARAVIAQRKDGVILFLVTDAGSVYGGPTLDQVIKVLEKYGAYNAANLDGGTSVQLVEKGNLLNNLRNIKNYKLDGRGVVTSFALYTD